MTLQEILDALPEYAKDIKLNLSSILANAEGHLTPQQVSGNLLVAAFAAKNHTLIKAVAGHAGTVLSEQDIFGIKAAATVMAMNNIYYRFTHLVSDKEYAKLPARLRMNVMANPGISKTDFELYSLAVSAINGCGMCMDAHAKNLEQHNVSKEAIQASVRIAAVAHALAQVMFIQGMD